MSKQLLIGPSTAAALSLALLGSPAGAQESIPSVIVTVENLQPTQGLFVTPPWLGIHDGTFDMLEVGSAATFPLIGDEIERLAEDGDAAPLAKTFDLLTGAPQVPALAGPSGPLGPGDRVSVTLNVDPTIDRYLSFAAMVIPSNDTFVANDDPLAHELFDASGDFVGRAFILSGDDTLDAGTEVNDELAVNTAFLDQAAPDTGVDELSVVTMPGTGFFDEGMLSYPDGVLNHPSFADAAFADADPPLLLVAMRSIDLGGRVYFSTRLGPGQEFQSELVQSDGRGLARVVSQQGATVLRVRIGFNDLSGPPTGAHLHLGQAGTNGPIVLDLGPGLRGTGVKLVVTDSSALTGPLAGQKLLALVNEIAAGNVYVNVHTAQYPAGEIRGQLGLRGFLRAARL